MPFRMQVIGGFRGPYCSCPSFSRTLRLASTSAASVAACAACKRCRKASYLRSVSQWAASPFNTVSSPTPRREVAGYVPGNVLWILWSHLPTERPTPDRCHTVTWALPPCNSRRVE